MKELTEGHHSVEDKRLCLSDLSQVWAEIARSVALCRGEQKEAEGSRRRLQKKAAEKGRSCSAFTAV